MEAPPARRASATYLTLLMFLAAPLALSLPAAASHGDDVAIDAAWGYELREAGIPPIPFAFLVDTGPAQEAVHAGERSTTAPVTFASTLYGVPVVTATARANANGLGVTLSSVEGSVPALHVEWSIRVSDPTEVYAWASPAFHDGAPAVAANAIIRQATWWGGIADAELHVLHVADGRVFIHATGYCEDVGCDDDAASISVQGHGGGGMSLSFDSFDASPSVHLEFRCMGDPAQHRCAMDPATGAAYDHCDSVNPEDCADRVCAGDCFPQACEHGEPVVPCAQRRVEETIEKACGDDALVPCARGVVDGAFETACGDADPARCTGLVDDALERACEGRDADACLQKVERTVEDALEDACDEPDAMACAEKARKTAEDGVKTAIETACGEPDATACTGLVDDAEELARFVVDTAVTAACGHDDAQACIDDAAKAVWRIACGTEDPSGCM